MSVSNAAKSRGNTDATKLGLGGPKKTKPQAPKAPSAFEQGMKSAEKARGADHPGSKTHPIYQGELSDRPKDGWATVCRFSSSCFRIVDPANPGQTLPRASVAHIKIVQTAAVVQGLLHKLGMKPGSIFMGDAVGSAKLGMGDFGSCEDVEDCFALDSLLGSMATLAGCVFMGLAGGSAELDSLVPFLAKMKSTATVIFFRANLEPTDPLQVQIFTVEQVLSKWNPLLQFSQATVNLTILRTKLTAVQSRLPYLGHGERGTWRMMKNLEVEEINQEIETWEGVLEEEEDALEKLEEMDTAGTARALIGTGGSVINHLTNRVGFSSSLDQIRVDIERGRFVHQPTPISNHLSEKRTDEQIISRVHEDRILVDDLRSVLEKEKSQPKRKRRRVKSSKEGVEEETVEELCVRLRRFELQERTEEAAGVLLKIRRLVDLERVGNIEVMEVRMGGMMEEKKGKGYGDDRYVDEKVLDI